MSRIAYVNGSYVPHQQASVHVEDRGYQFADGVYEVIAVRGGRFVDEEPHLDRLERSLGELDIAAPMSRRAMKIVMRQVLRRNRVHNGILYMQITRGVAARDHAFPRAAEAAIVMTARRAKSRASLGVDGVSVITVPDIRWKRCDIKSISLLPNILGKQAAVDAGAYEALQIDADGYITEGTASNAWIVTSKGELTTRTPDNAILNGVTRLAVIDLALREGLAFVERAFTADEAAAAREAFVTSTSSNVMPVVRIDDRIIGDGKPGPLSRKLMKLYAAHASGAAR